MRKKIFFIKILMFFLFISLFAYLCVNRAYASDDISLVTSFEEFNQALTVANNGDTIYVDDIEFPYNNSPSNMIIISKNLIIKGGKDNKSIFKNAMFSLYGNENESVNIKFENIDFRGNLYGIEFDSENPPNVSSKGLNMLKTMMAFIFDKNVNAYYNNCDFEGYHYGYGGIFSATKYSNVEDKYQLHIELKYCNFKNNYSHHGGIAYLYGSDQDLMSLSAYHCTFKNNYAATGGVIFGNKASINLVDCDMINNHFLAYDMTALSNGGALALHDCVALIDGCLFSKNDTHDFGAAIYAEIIPYKSFIIRNTTIIGNTGTNDNGLCINLANTNFDVSPKIYISFSTIFGNQMFNDNVETFGCVLTSDTNTSPNNSNNYNKTIIKDELQEIDYNNHVTFNNDLINLKDYNKYFHTNLNNINYYVGDNYKKELNLQIKYSPKNTKEVKVLYGESISLDDPSRKGFEFTGWKDFENGFTYLGGEVVNTLVQAKWHFKFLENWYYTILPLSIVLLFLISFVLIMFHENRLKNIKTENDKDNLKSDSIDWIEKACKNEKIISMLTQRELEVLKKLLIGESRKQIADDLFLSESTVKKHLSGIYEKFGVKNRSELSYKITKDYK